MDSLEARLALADVLAEDVTSAGFTGHLARGIVLTGVGAAGAFGNVVEDTEEGEFNRGRVVISSYFPLMGLG